MFSYCFRSMRISAYPCPLESRHSLVFMCHRMLAFLRIELKKKLSYKQSWEMTTLKTKHFIYNKWVFWCQREHRCVGKTSERKIESSHMLGKENDKWKNEEKNFWPGMKPKTKQRIKQKKSNILCLRTMYYINRVITLHQATELCWKHIANDCRFMRVCIFGASYSLISTFSPEEDKRGTESTNNWRIITSKATINNFQEIKDQPKMNWNYIGGDVNEQQIRLCECFQSFDRSTHPCKSSALCKSTSIQ